jgi:hypothetical protein
MWYTTTFWNSISQKMPLKLQTCADSSGSIARDATQEWRTQGSNPILPEVDAELNPVSQSYRVTSLSDPDDQIR